MVGKSGVEVISKRIEAETVKGKFSMVGLMNFLEMRNRGIREDGSTITKDGHRAGKTTRTAEREETSPANLPKRVSTINSCVTRSSSATMLKKTRECLISERKSGPSRGRKIWTPS